MLLKWICVVGYVGQIAPANLTGTALGLSSTCIFIIGKAGFRIRFLTKKPEYRALYHEWREMYIQLYKINSLAQFKSLPSEILW